MPNTNGGYRPAAPQNARTAASIAAQKMEKAKAKPSPSPSTSRQKTDWTEKELQRLLKKGVSLDKARDQASKKYGIYPNGYTN